MASSDSNRSTNSSSSEAVLSASGQPVAPSTAKPAVLPANTAGGKSAFSQAALGAQDATEDSGLAQGAELGDAGADDAMLAVNVAGDGNADTVVADSAVAEEAADESSGLFGGLVAGLGGGTGLAAGAAVVGLAALGGGGGDDAASGSSTATDASGMSGSNSSGTGTGGTGDGVGDNMSGGEAGMFTGGAQSLTDAAPIDAIPTAGPAIEGGLVSGAGQLDANSPASASGSPADADNASTAGADAALVALPTQAGSAPDDDSLGMLLDSAGASGISSTAGPDLSGTALPAPPV